MTYTLNRPPGMKTVVWGPTQVVHLATGLRNMHGTRIACGATLDELSYRHVQPEEVVEAVTCKRCKPIARRAGLG